jgi:hypothetical protein
MLCSSELEGSVIRILKNAIAVCLMGVGVPVGARDFSPHHCVQTGSGALPVSCTMGTRGSLGAWCSVKKYRRFTFTFIRTSFGGTEESH